MRVKVDDSGERMRAKIRNAQLDKIPYVLVVGDREVQGGHVAVRLRSGEDRGSQPVAEFMARAVEIVRLRQADL